MCGRLGLRLLEPFYRLGVAVRNAGFDLDWKTIHRADVPVVSIGNVTTGGTGKTPFAAYVARWYRERGVRVCFVSRGYGAESGEVNDEALVLDQLCPDVPHLQNPDRVAAARTAIEELETQLIVLDDGFQHRRLHRDLDVVLIDAVNPWGYGHLLPRGLLREPRSALRRADLVVITRVDQVEDQVLAQLRLEITRITNSPPVEVTFPPTRLINAVGKTAEIDSLSQKTLGLFCGIGNPPAFFETVETLGLTVSASREFPDHHRYSREDIESLAAWSRDNAFGALLVTQKDLVKLAETHLAGKPLWALEIGCRVDAGEEVLAAALSNAMPALSGEAAL